VSPSWHEPPRERRLGMDGFGWLAVLLLALSGWWLA
jgi:hypothetical protein